MRTVCDPPPGAGRPTRRVQRAVAVEKSALRTRWWKRIRSSTPNSRAVSATYSRMEAPSAMALAPRQGRKEYPRVCMSESERTPG